MQFSSPLQLVLRPARLAYEAGEARVACREAPGVDGPRGREGERSASLWRGRSTPPGKTEAQALGGPVRIHAEEELPPLEAGALGLAAIPSFSARLSSCRGLASSCAMRDRGYMRGAKIRGEHSRFPGSIVFFKELRAATTKDDEARPARSRKLLWGIGEERGLSPPSQIPDPPPPAAPDTRLSLVGNRAIEAGPKAALRWELQRQLVVVESRVWWKPLGRNNLRDCGGRRARGEKPLGVGSPLDVTGLGAPTSRSREYRHQRPKAAGAGKAQLPAAGKGREKGSCGPRIREPPPKRQPPRSPLEGPGVLTKFLALTPGPPNFRGALG